MPLTHTWVEYTPLHAMQITHTPANDENAPAYHLTYVNRNGLQENDIVCFWASSLPNNISATRPYFVHIPANDGDVTNDDCIALKYKPIPASEVTTNDLVEFDASQAAFGIEIGDQYAPGTWWDIFKVQEVSALDIGKIQCQSSSSTEVTKYFGVRFMYGKAQNIKVALSQPIVDIYPFAASKAIVRDVDITNSDYKVEFYMNKVVSTSTLINTVVSVDTTITLSSVDAGYTNSVDSEPIGFKVKIPATNDVSVDIDGVEVRNLGFYLSYDCNGE